ncbi:MAG: squalene--hopene cyclase, partial [Opitutae bacterium]|nr:squalene--hopene cyclase [Opitutae bacterium]
MKSLLTLIFIWTVFASGTLRAQKLFEEANDDLVRQIDRMYKQGQGYLAKSQTDGGNWSDNSYGSQAGVVGLATLALLARGDDPEFGPYRITVKRSLDYILARQDKKTGYIGSSMYNHGFATLALAEAYGITNDLRLGPALQKATDLILGSQKGNSKGAWRYGPESKDADTTVSGAQMVALFAARNAGLSVPESA